MTSVLQCDGCGKLVSDDEKAEAQWLLISRFAEKKDSDDGPIPVFGPRFDVVGHCCSIECLANLALAQNKDFERSTDRYDRGARGTDG